MPTNKLYASVLNAYTNAIKMLGIGVFLMFFCVNAQAQTAAKRDLEKQRKAILQEIKQAQTQLNTISKQKNSSLEEVAALRTKIRKREVLIKALSVEVMVLEIDTRQNKTIAEALTNDLEKLKVEYADVIRHVYTQRTTFSLMMYVLSAENFNQAYRRLRYVQQYNSFRKKQAQLIAETQKNIENKIKTIESQIAEKQALLSQQEVQKRTFVTETTEETQKIDKLAENEKGILTNINDKRRARQNLEAQIENIVRIEAQRAEEERQARLAARRAKEGEKHTAEPNNPNADIAAAPEAPLAGATFGSNRGRLPWPVAKGKITETFGEHPHPLLKGIKTVNNGIDIGTPPNSSVQSVFEGEVKRVFTVPGMQKTVIIRHGNYLTVYAHLGDVNVQQGQNVIANQPIGIAHTDPTTGETEVHLEIWQGTQQLNPQPWLAR
jgi:septal ring factor EnvC (AmiA/AmiB activator)